MLVHHALRMRILLHMCFLQAYKRWKGIELKLTDAANEANDNVRYLTTLERAFEVRQASFVAACLAARC
jgi:dynein heavy chain